MKTAAQPEEGLFQAAAQLAGAERAAFLDGAVPFPGIPRTIEKVLNATSSHAPASIQDVLAADEAARECARGVIARHAASGLRAWP